MCESFSEVVGSSLCSDTAEFLGDFLQFLQTYYGMGSKINP
jgi:hypothetical protein